MVLHLSNCRTEFRGFVWVHGSASRKQHMVSRGQHIYDWLIGGWVTPCQQQIAIFTNRSAFCLFPFTECKNTINYMLKVTYEVKKLTIRKCVIKKKKNSMFMLCDFPFITMAHLREPVSLIPNWFWLPSCSFLVILLPPPSSLALAPKFALGEHSLSDICLHTTHICDSGSAAVRW